MYKHKEQEPDWSSLNVIIFLPPPPSFVSPSPGDTQYAIRYRDLAADLQKTHKKSDLT